MSDARNEKAKAQQEQILNLFVPGEKMIATRVSKRLEERTGGRGKLPAVIVIDHLKVLVSQEKLLETSHQKVLQGLTINVIEYFLPETTK